MIQPEEVTILKNSIAKGASDEELKFCLTVARRYKLDPFKQQIWFVKRWDSSAENGAGGTGAYVWTPQVGINGLLFAAARDHREEFGSISKPQYGEEVKGAPVWASVKITKKNGSVTEAEARWSEYAPADLGKAPFWRKMPYRMLGKCATALAVREAYPDLGGLYILEEMEKINEEYTKEGRRIIEKAGLDVPQMGTHAAGQAVGQAKIAELRDKMAKPIEAVMDAPSDIPKANRPEPLPKDLPPMPEHDDIDDVWPRNAKHSTGSPVEATPTADGQPGHTAAQGRGGSSRPTPAAETKLVVGTILQVFAPQNQKSPRRDVKVLTDGKKPTFGCFKQNFFADLDKGSGAIEAYVEKVVKADGTTYFNIVGLKKLGTKEWLEDGTPVIQQSTREAGGKTLYD